MNGYQIRQIEELLLQMCYDGRLQNADSTLLVNRPQSPSRHFVHPKGVRSNYGCPASVPQGAYRRVFERKDKESQKTAFQGDQ